MYSTSVYYYLPRQVVVLNFGNSVRRYNTVYAKNLKLHRNVDNRIQFQFINQEQKPVNISDKEITFRLISYDGTTVLLQKALTLVLPLTGIAELQVESGLLTDIDPQLCSYSLEIPVDGWDLPVFVDDNAGARGVINVVDSVLPSFLPSYNITIPSHVQPNANSNVNVTFYSSTFSTTHESVVTLQPYYTEYSGNVQIQGSTLPDADFYNIGEVFTYSNVTSTVGYNVEGYHPYIRIKFQSTNGSVDKILAR